MLTLLDTAGHDNTLVSYRQIISKADAFLLVYDRSQRDTVDRLVDILDLIKEMKHSDSYAAVVLGNKRDKDPEIQH